MTFYRFITADGREYQGDDLRKIRKAHPGAIITHTVETDERGVAVSAKPFSGQAVIEPEPEAAPRNAVEDAPEPVAETEPAATKTTRKATNR